MSDKFYTLGLDRNELSMRSKHLLNVLIANKNTVFHVRYFNENNFKGSKGGFFNKFKIIGKSRSGTSFRMCERELNTPLPN